MHIPNELLPIYVLSEETTYPAGAKAPASAVFVPTLFLFSVSLRLTQPLASCCALHSPAESDVLWSKVSSYTVILYLLDEHICLLQGSRS